MFDKYDRIGQLICGIWIIGGGVLFLIGGRGGANIGYARGDNIRVAGAIGICLGIYLLYDLIKKK
jgi:hypothetical protein